jgi:hypothetical protein
MINKRKTQNAKRKVKTQSFPAKAGSCPILSSWWEKFLVLSFIFSLYALRLTLCSAQPISSTELINNARQYDGKTVTYAGEVIADVMKRGDYAWINVNDGANAIGIWIRSSLSKNISFTGSYKFKGDIVEVTGVFHRACPEHGADLDIHAQAMRKVNTGRPIQEKLNPGKRNQAIILLGVLCLIWILTRFKHK